jgi:hypothetical protein
MKLFLMISGILLVACHSLKPATQIKQGISGFVYRESGNQMPAPNRPTRAPKGISCELYIYLPATFKQTEGSNPVFMKINTKLITVAHSDSTGHYAVDLPPGKYSVFIKQADQYFASESDGDGILNPVEVKPGKVTVKDWKLRVGAVY